MSIILLIISGSEWHGARVFDNAAHIVCRVLQIDTEDVGCPEEGRRGRADERRGCGPRGSKPSGQLSVGLAMESRGIASLIGIIMSPCMFAKWVGWGLDLDLDPKPELEPDYHHVGKCLFFFFFFVGICKRMGESIVISVYDNFSFNTSIWLFVAY